ncbi:MAG: hypothetical protein MUC63_07570, partial [Planctomycetes bacterium]|nr:hypothetical protein [Planctomycetota bacterium]
MNILVWAEIEGGRVRKASREILCEAGRRAGPSGRVWGAALGPGARGAVEPDRKLADAWLLGEEGPFAAFDLPGWAAGIRAAAGGAGAEAV